MVREEGVAKQLTNSFMAFHDFPTFFPQENETKCSLDVLCGK